jgi:hypothetical protein
MATSERPSTLDRAIAESVQSEIRYYGGRQVSVKRITDYMAHRALIDDHFWAAWDATVRSVREAFTSHEGIRQRDNGMRG